MIEFLLFGLLAPLAVAGVIWGVRVARKPVFISFNEPPLTPDVATWVLTHQRYEYEAKGYRVVKERRLRREIHAFNRSGEECVYMMLPDVHLKFHDGAIVSLSRPKRRRLV